MEAGEHISFGQPFRFAGDSSVGVNLSTDTTALKDTPKVAIGPFDGTPVSDYLFRIALLPSYETWYHFRAMEITQSNLRARVLLNMSECMVSFIQYHDHEMVNFSKTRNLYICHNAVQIL